MEGESQLRRELASDTDVATQDHHTYTSNNEIPFETTYMIGLGMVGLVEEVLGKKEFEGHIYARKTILLDRNQQLREAQLREIENEVNIL